MKRILIAPKILHKVRDRVEIPSLDILVSKVECKIGESGVLQVENSPRLSPGKIHRTRIYVEETEKIVQSSLSFDCTEACLTRLAALVTMDKPIGMDREARFYIELPEKRILLDPIDKCYLFMTVSSMSECKQLVCASIGYDRELNRLYIAPRRVTKGGSVMSMIFAEIYGMIGEDKWNLHFSGTLRLSMG